MASAAILVGGRAVRFGGQDKHALVVGGRSIFDRQVEALLQVTDDILVVGGHGQGLTKGLRHVSDRAPDSGPLGGLDAALTAARDAELVLIACDMPWVTAPFLAHLLALTAEADAVVPRTERGYHPLCGAYTRACHPAVQRRVADRRLSMRGLLEEVRVRTVFGPEIEQFGEPARLLANVNTPDDLKALLFHEP